MTWEELDSLLMVCQLLIVVIIQYSTTVYRDYGSYGFLFPKISPQNQLDIYFVTSRQYSLGIAKLKNVFRSFLTHSKNLLQNFNNSVFSRTFY